MMQDVWLLEKLAHFDREVIPERSMHAKGWGAYGTFTVTHDITRYTKAKVFCSRAKRPMCSSASRRSPASAARPTPSATSAASPCKFYTEEGNWDLVGNNTPTFFLRDVHNFPDLNRAVKRDPDRHALGPEQLGLLDAAARDLPPDDHRHVRPRHPRGFRHMHVFGEHTFSFYNEKNERVWCKFHFKTQQGIKNLTMRRRRSSTAWTARATAATCTRPSSAATSRSGRCTCRS
jgi:catalase